MDTAYFRKFLVIAVIVSLLVASFFLLKPILMSIILGLILAFIFSPIYNLIYRVTRSPNFSATFVCIILILLIVLPIWFFTPMVIDQVFKVYLSAQKTDFVVILKQIFPSFFSSQQFSTEIGGMMHTFVVNTANSLLNALSEVITNFASLALQVLVILFTFYFTLRDKEQLGDYVKSLSPFSKDIEHKLFKYSKDITASVLYGQVLIGIIQGIILAIGLFIFGVPNALLLSIVAIIAGILPILGPMAVWIPVLVYLLVVGNTGSAIGILVFGLIASNIEHILRPMFISRMTQLHSGIVLIGMIAGLFLFGVLGLIIGPLILAYLIVILDAYREQNVKGSLSKLFIKED
jgi:predicted PurR-regulated permease PerM